MANVEKYRQIIQQLLTEYATRRNAAKDGVEAQTIFDIQQDRYQLLYIGWDNQNRIFGPIIHFDIQDSKVWLQWNGTEDEIGEILVSRGIPKDNIVIGFHPQFLRKYTDYAVN